MAEQHYSIVASLPRLPHFTRADVLPLSLHELRSRLAFLPEELARDLWYVLPMLSWSRLQRERQDRRQIQRARTQLERIAEPALREVLHWRFEQLSVVAALRRKQAGQPAPGASETWGIGRWINLIRARWERPGFGLEAQLPWLPEAERLLGEGAAHALDRLLLEQYWRFLSRLAERSSFGVEPIIAFVFKWDCLRSWLANDAEASANRFHALVHEVTRDYRIA